MRRRIAVLSGLLAVLLLAGCAVSAPDVTGVSGPDVTGVTVPDVSGKSEDAAGAVLRAAGLKVGAVAYDGGSEGATWTVVAQAPAAGSRAETGSGVRLTLAGPPPVVVPNLAAFGAQEASASLASLGLRLGVITQSNNASVPAGLIVTQTPAPGVRVPEGETVALAISKGPAPVAVPKVVGKSLSRAREIMAAAGFKVKSTTAHDPHAKGTVIAQAPSGGTARTGTTVRLTVSDGIVMVRVPNLNHYYLYDDMAQAEARLLKVLKPLGLRLSWNHHEGEFHQSPSAGTWVPRGTVVVVRTPEGTLSP